MSKCSSSVKQHYTFSTPLHLDLNFAILPFLLKSGCQDLYTKNSFANKGTLVPQLSFIKCFFFTAFEHNSLNHPIHKLTDENRKVKTIKSVIKYIFMFLYASYKKNKRKNI